LSALFILMAVCTFLSGLVAFAASVIAIITGVGDIQERRSKKKQRLSSNLDESDKKNTDEIGTRETQEMPQVLIPIEHSEGAENVPN